jgi:hypothetical protein
MAKKRVDEPQYPLIAKVIALRCKQVYGSVNRLAQKVGISRQTLHCRIRSAGRWHLTHQWWATILHLPMHILVGTIDDVATIPAPKDFDVDMVLKRERKIWEQTYDLRWTWGIHQKIAE